jgi:hypothetical protein
VSQRAVVLLTRHEIAYIEQQRAAAKDAVMSVHDDLRALGMHDLARQLVPALVGLRMLRVATLAMKLAADTGETFVAALRRVQAGRVERRKAAREMA